CRWTADARLMACAGDPKELTVLNAADGRLVAKIEARSSMAALAPDGRELAAVTDAGEVARWSLPDGKLVGTEHGLQSPSDLGYTADGTLLALMPDGDLRVRTGDGPLPWRPFVSRHAGWVHDWDLSGDGSRLATASHDHTLRLWDLRSRGEELRMDLPAF